MNYADFDACELSLLIRKKEFTVKELLESVISNIEQYNPLLNAVIFTQYEQARDEAELLDMKLRQSGQDFNPGPLFGVPFLMKNLLADCKGSQFTDGSRFVHGNISNLDSAIVKRYRSAGLIPCGRTNASEFGVMPTTEPALYGPTLNPWNTGYTPGGSSGGSAAAVASRIVPAAHGNDGGGSLRIPGSCCGLFALKPSRARNPLGPLFGDIASGIVCEHALTRSVRDSAALLDISSGPQTGDPYYAPKAEGSFLKQVETPPGKLKIAFLTEVPEGWNDIRELHPHCREAVDDAATLCAELGHHVEQINSRDLSWPDLPGTFISVFCSFIGHAVRYWERTLGKKIRQTDLEPATWDLYSAGLKITGGDYLSAIENLQLFSRKIAVWYEKGGWDILLSPCMRIPPTPIGAFDPDPAEPEKWINNALSFVAFTRTQNITGHPAMSVPLYWNSQGLPMGVQFAGSMGSEDLLFRLAGQLEKARPWISRRPGVSV